jgi:hypothetical protein
MRCGVAQILITLVIPHINTCDVIHNHCVIQSRSLRSHIHVTNPSYPRRDDHNDDSKINNDVADSRTIYPVHLQRMHPLMAHHSALITNIYSKSQECTDETTSSCISRLCQRRERSVRNCDIAPLAHRLGGVCPVSYNNR